MNMSAKEFNEKVMGRISPMIKDGKIEQTIRFSLLFANDGKGHKVDLVKLSTFSDGDFWHDVIGINNHASREYETVGQLVGGFVPRCGFEKEV